MHINIFMQIIQIPYKLNESHKKKSFVQLQNETEPGLFYFRNILALFDDLMLLSSIRSMQNLFDRCIRFNRPLQHLRPQFFIALPAKIAWSHIECCLASAHTFQIHPISRSRISHKHAGSKFRI